MKLLGISTLSLPLNMMKWSSKDKDGDHAVTNQWFHYQNGQNSYPILSIGEAMDIALAQVPGQVVKVELETEFQRQVYEVDIIAQNGIKYEVLIDAHSGQFLGVQVD